MHLPRPPHVNVGVPACGTHEQEPQTHTGHTHAEVSGAKNGRRARRNAANSLQPARGRTRCDPRGWSTRRPPAARTPRCNPRGLWSTRREPRTDGGHVLRGVVLRVARELPVGLAHHPLVRRRHAAPAGAGGEAPGLVPRIALLQRCAENVAMRGLALGASPFKRIALAVHILRGACAWREHRFR